MSITYKRPSGTTITVRDTEGNREQAAALDWKEVKTVAEPEEKPKRGRPKGKTE